MRIQELKTDVSFRFGLKQFKIMKGMSMENDSTKVSVGLGYTLNLGNFQSLRIDLSVTDSKRDGENVGEAFERVYKFVEDKLAEKVKEAASEIEA